MASNASGRIVKRGKLKVWTGAVPATPIEAAIREARSRGVMGGGNYDSLHGAFARRKKAAQIVTRNPSHFQHVAPDIDILTP